MKFLQDLYLGETIVPKVNQIVEKVNNNQIVPNLYLIALSETEDNMLDLIPEWEVLQKGYPKESIQVVGLANGKKEAVSMVQFMIEESLQETHCADVRSFIKSKWEGQA